MRIYSECLKHWLSPRKKQRTKIFWQKKRNLHNCGIDCCSTVSFQFCWRKKNVTALNRSHEVEQPSCCFSKVSEDAASRLHSWLIFDKQARNVSGSWTSLRNSLLATSNENSDLLYSLRSFCPWLICWCLSTACHLWLAAWPDSMLLWLKRHSRAE